MNYRNLLEELQSLSSQELQQPVTFQLCDDIKNGKCEDLIDASEVDWVVCHGHGDGKNQEKVTILV